MGEALSILMQAKELSHQTIPAKAAAEYPPHQTSREISNWLESIHKNDTHANFSDQYPIIQLTSLSRMQ